MLSVRGAVKRYGPTLALGGVDVEVRAGEVLGVVGANGAGKSTLIKLISGAERPTAGVIAIDGRTIPPLGPDSARSFGVETVHQAVEQALVPDLTVADNLVLEEMAGGGLGRFPSRGRVMRRAEELAGGRLEVDLATRVEALSPSLRQQILIARALATRPPFLILDEPSASLSVVERRRLHESIRRLAAEGTGVVYITHHLDELEQVCTRAVALRDGVVTGEFSSPFRRSSVIRAMLGSLVETGHPDEVRDQGSALMRGTGLIARPGGPPFDFEVRSGEVLGITGLIGAGKTELLVQLFGSAPLLGGRLTFDGRDYVPEHPASAISRGLGFVPEDRAASGLISDWSLSKNLTLPEVATKRRSRLLSRSRERAAAIGAIDRLGIVCDGPDAPVRTLSGGNQQKVVVARWLAGGTRLLLLDEPFRGVDIRARADINRLLRSKAVESAVVASSDPEEVLDVADRILVMAGGGVVGEVAPSAVEGDGLARLMAGES